MISKEQMFAPILIVTPSFAKTWEEFLIEWQNHSDGLPYYLALGELANHLIILLEGGKYNEIHQIFEVAEEWLISGDRYVKEATTVGFLENLQNNNLHKNTPPNDFVQFLKPETAFWWNKVERFWEHGELICDERNETQ
ncbi:hypothetical protein [uncultured Roseovarius sp.]|uniref:DUF7674 family protein n=1 Tax=uncultured Roseovarius sp. TaxID=293344 RepID=UPI002598F5EB|nr:hypothetical protein [uncultured Roseovarius sp.]